MPGSSILGILQARILECVAMPFSRDWTWISCAVGWREKSQWSISLSKGTLIWRSCGFSYWAFSQSELPCCPFIFCFKDALALPSGMHLGCLGAQTFSFGTDSEAAWGIISESERALTSQRYLKANLKIQYLLNQLICHCQKLSYTENSKAFAFA